MVTPDQEIMRRHMLGTNSKSHEMEIEVFSLLTKDTEPKEEKHVVCVFSTY